MTGFNFFIIHNSALKSGFHVLWILSLLLNRSYGQLNALKPFYTYIDYPEINCLAATSC